MSDLRFKPGTLLIGKVAVAIAVLALTASLYGQDPTGRIYGRVVDPSGGVIPGAELWIEHADTGLKRVVVTNAEGNYNAAKLKTGTYKVVAAMPGFKTWQRPGIIVGAGSVWEVNIALAPGEIKEVVSVEAAAPLVNTTSGAVRNSFETVFIERLPMNGRDANQLMLLIPGVTPSNSGGGSFTVGYNANGVRGTSNNFTLDGTDNMDAFNSKGSKLPPPDALMEFTVQSNYSAEYGGGGGVAVTALIRSGTNTLHGSAYDYFRSENLNANSFQRNALGRAKTDFKQHQLGFTAGGPVLIPKLYNGRNRTFFFFSHQQLRVPSSPYLWARGGVTAAELAGDFSKSSIVPKVSSAAAAQPNSPFAGMSGQNVTNLANLLSPTAVKWYKYFDLPLVANSADRFFESKTSSASLPEYALRIDHSIGGKHNLGFSMTYRNYSPSLTQIDYAPERFTTAIQQKNQHYTLQDVWTISPSTVNEILVGYNRIWEPVLFDGGGTDYKALGLAYPQFTPDQFIQVGTLSPNFFNMQAADPKYEGRDAYDYRDIFSFVRGNHFMKGGAFVQLRNTITSATVHNVFNYNGGWLTNRAAEFLIGWPSSTVLEEPRLRTSRKYVAQFFFQDDWKVTPRLSINLGIRYEPQIWAYLKNDRGLIFIPGAKSQYSNFPLGLLTVTDAASPGRSGRPNDMNNWAPRIGVAYKLNESDTMVVRGGWGIFYDSTDSNKDGVALTAQFPFNYRYDPTFNRGFPANDAWLDPITYMGLSRPDFSQPSNVATAVFDPKATYGTYFPDSILGYVHQYNLSFEHEFRPGWSYSLGYVGSKGVDLVAVSFWNVPLSRDANDSWNVENMAERRPLQDYRYSTRQTTPAAASSLYHGGQAIVKARAKDFQMLAHYTYSASFADMDGLWGQARRPSRPDFWNWDWARTLSDRPHVLFLIPTWDLPVLRGRTDLLGKILGGWSATGVFNAMSGSPVEIRAAQNNTFTCDSCFIRPNVVTGKARVFDNWRDDPKLTFINTAAFSQPEDRTYGNLARNAVRFPRTVNADLNLTKAFRLVGEDVKFELKADFFNLFNWVNWMSPEALQLGTSAVNFTMQNRSGTPRTIQVGARISF